MQIITEWRFCAHIENQSIWFVSYLVIFAGGKLQVDIITTREWYLIQMIDLWILLCHHRKYFVETKETKSMEITGCCLLFEMWSAVLNRRIPKSCVVQYSNIILFPNSFYTAYFVINYPHTVIRYATTQSNQQDINVTSLTSCFYLFCIFIYFCSSYCASGCEIVFLSMIKVYPKFISMRRWFKIICIQYDRGHPQKSIGWNIIMDYRQWNLKAE